MKISKSRYKANTKWNNENYWTPKVYLPKDYKEKISASGMSINSFIKAAIDEKLEKMK